MGDKLTDARIRIMGERCRHYEDEKWQTKKIRIVREKYRHYWGDMLALLGTNADRRIRTALWG